MNLWHDSGIPEALATANGAMATDACAKSPRSASDAEMALLNLKLKIEAYFQTNKEPKRTA